MIGVRWVGEGTGSRTHVNAKDAQHKCRSRIMPYETGEHSGGVESDRTRFPIDDITPTMLWHCHVSTQISTHSGSARSCLHDYDQMEILLEAAQARQTLPARAASVLRVLALRALPTTFAETRSSTPSQCICLLRSKSLISMASCFHPSLIFRQALGYSCKNEKLLLPPIYINIAGI